jgi:hypothetical protein
VDISKFSTFFSFLGIFHIKSVNFSFSVILSFHAIFQVLRVYLKFIMFCNISRHISLTNECYSPFLWFSVFLPYSMSYGGHF